MLFLLLLLLLLLSSLFLLLVQCASFNTNSLTETCLEHSQIFGWRIWKIASSYDCWLFLQKLCLECLTVCCICLKFISFILFIRYSFITSSIYSLTFLFINLCIWFKSVYTDHFSLLFSYVMGMCYSHSRMFYHFCLRNLYMKTFVRLLTFFNLLIKLQKTMHQNTF